MKKRLFIAIELSEKLKNEIALYQQAIVKDLDVQPRLTAKENLHVTVSFLDTIEESYIPGLIEQLKDVTPEVSPFTLQYESTIFGPPGRFSSMIWIVYEPSNEFTHLLREINGKVVTYLKKYSQPVLLSSHQEPVPHITLARFKDKIQTIQTSFAPFSTKDLSVSSYTLMHSQLSPKGPTYASIETYELIRTPQLHNE